MASVKPCGNTEAQVKHDIEITLRLGGEIRREGLSGHRRLITYGLFTQDALEEELLGMVSSMYRDMVGEIITEEAGDDGDA